MMNTTDTKDHVADARRQTNNAAWAVADRFEADEYGDEVWEERRMPEVRFYMGYGAYLPYHDQDFADDEAAESFAMFVNAHITTIPYRGSYSAVRERIASLRSVWEASMDAACDLEAIVVERTVA